MPHVAGDEMGVVVASDMVVDTEERPTAGDARDDIADVVPDDLAGIDVDEGPQAVQAGACPADAPHDDATSIDGRRARRDRNMATVVDALLELFNEGQLHPTAMQLAERSGVSLRSVFRYFDDMHDLTLRAIETQLQRVADLYELAPRPADATLAERVATIAGHRSRLYFAVAPIARAAAIRVHRSPALADLSRERRDLVRRQTEEYFRPELDLLPPDERSVLLGCIDAGTQFETGENLQVRMGMRPELLEEAYRLSLTRLLAPFA